MRVDIVPVEIDRLACRRNGFFSLSFLVIRKPAHNKHEQRVGQPRVGRAEGGIELDRLAKQILGAAKIFFALTIGVVHAPLIKIPRIEAVDGLCAGPFDFGFSQFWMHGAHDGGRDLVLKLKYVLQITVVALHPQVFAGGALDQLGGYANPITGLAHAALQHIVDTQILGDVPDVGGLIFV